MTTSISSEALLPFVAWPTDRRTNNCRIDAHIPEECAHRKWWLYLIEGPRKSRFSLNLAYRHTDRQTYIHTDRRTDISVYRVASLLIKIDTSNFFFDFFYSFIKDNVELIVGICNYFSLDGMSRSSGPIFIIFGFTIMFSFW